MTSQGNRFYPMTLTIHIHCTKEDVNVKL